MRADSPGCAFFVAGQEAAGGGDLLGPAEPAIGVKARISVSTGVPDRFVPAFMEATRGRC
jgi:hypothetical protein